MRSSHSIVRFFAYGRIGPLVSVFVLGSIFAMVVLPGAVGAVALFDCRPASETGYIVPHERLLWMLPADQAEDRRFPSYQPHAREAGVVELRFDDKLESSVVLNCGGTSTDWIERVALHGRTAEVRLRGTGTRWRVDLEERALIVWNPRAVAQAVSRRWPATSVRTLLSEARHLGIAPENIDDLERRLEAAERREKGFIAFSAGRFEEAVGHLQAAFEALPNDVESGLALARARYQLAHYDRAEELLESLADDAPRSAEIRHEQGLLALSRGDRASPDRASARSKAAGRDDARRHFRAAAAGGWPNASFYLGFLAFEDGDDPEALAVLGRFLAHDPDGPLSSRAQRMLTVLAERRAQVPRSLEPVRGGEAVSTTWRERNTDVASARNDRHPERSASGAPAVGPDAAPAVTRSDPRSEHSRKPMFLGRQVTLRGFERADLPMASLDGRPMVLHLWATWCPPCRREMPSLMRFARERMPILEARGLSLITVSMDYTEDELADVASAWAQEIDGDLPPIYWDPNWRLAEQLGLGSALPQTVLVASDGSVRTVLVGAQDWNDETFEAQLLSLAASAVD